MKKNMSRRDFLKGVGAGALGIAAVGILGACSGNDKETSAGTSAEVGGTGGTDWPKEDINLVLGYGAGGDSDVCTRYMAEAVGKELGVNVIVTNMGGSNGGIAAEEIMNISEPEYNFLVINTSSLSINCITGIADYTYEAFEPISIFASYSGETLYVPKDAPYDTLEEFLDYAKEHEVKMGVAMGGTLYAVAAAMKAAGYQFNIVDAGDGVDRVPATINGTIDCTFAAYSSNRDYIENGDLKELATLCSEPIPAAPELPCVCDYIDGVVVDTKFVILAQKGVDSSVCQKFNDALQEMYKNNKDYVKNVEDFSCQTAKPQTIEETRTSLKNQYETFQNYAEYL